MVEYSLMIMGEKEIICLLSYIYISAMYMDLRELYFMGLYKETLYNTGSNLLQDISTVNIVTLCQSWGM